MKKLLYLLPLAVSTLFFSFCSGKQQQSTVAAAPADSVAPARHEAKDFLLDCKQLLRDARRMDSILLKQTEVDVPSANKAIKAFTDLAFYCPNDTMCPIYLVKAAQVAQAINNIPQAKAALDRCISEYTGFRDRPAALFLLAQLYDEVTYLNNEEEARRLYQEIMDKYPKSPWAASAKGALGFIGKSDKQIMEELKKKSK